MKLDVAVPIEGNPLPGMAAWARAADALGFAAIWTPETGHNPFLPLVLAAEHTRRITLGTSVAIAFPRSPMVTAQVAWDLACLAEGRFILGLGTQVKAHIERRFGVAWDTPVARLRDYIGALRAIWSCWQNGSRLNYQGAFYKLSLMTPFFSPGPSAYPHIPIYIAGVNSGLAQLAGETCDGFSVHPLNSAKYLREVLRPQITEGAQKAGRSIEELAISGSVFAITGRDEASIARTRAFAQQQISFYGSTPTYRGVLECHGWGALGEDLSKLAASQRWAEMPALISDEVLAVLAIEAPPEQLGAAIRQRFDGLLDRVALYTAFVPGQDDDFWRGLVGAFDNERA